MYVYLHICRWLVCVAGSVCWCEALVLLLLRAIHNKKTGDDDGFELVTNCTMRGMSHTHARTHTFSLTHTRHSSALRGLSSKTENREALLRERARIELFDAQHIYIYMCIHIYMYTYTCMYIDIQTHMYIYICIYIYIHIYFCLYVGLCVHVCVRMFFFPQISI